MMENIGLLESYIKNIKSKEVNKTGHTQIIDLLNAISVLDPQCLSEGDYEKLIEYLPLLPDIYNYQVLAAACNVIATLCSDDLARQYFGEKTIVSIVNILKSLKSHTDKEKYVQECLLQAGRAIGNLCYYHEQNTKCALEEECLLITMEILRTNIEENLCPVLIGILLNLTHLENYNYKFTDNVIEELNSFGIKCLEYNNNNYKSYINLVSVMINIVRKPSSNSKITDYDKCTFIDRLLSDYSIDFEITSICIKFIKQVSKVYNIYSWILNGKHHILTKILDNYEENHQDNAKCIVKKICDIITLLSNDDSSMDNNKQLGVLYLVEWLLLKIHSNNLYIKLSAVRSLGNFSRFKYDSNNSVANPADNIIKHMPWFINTLEKSVKDQNSLMEVSILCLFKNLLYVTNLECLDENNKNKLIKTTIEVLNHNSFNPIVMKSLDAIICIIKKGGISQKQLALYKNSTFIKLVTSYTNCVDEDINKLAKKLIYSINESINTSEIDALYSVEDNLKIQD